MEKLVYHFDTSDDSGVRLETDASFELVKGSNGSGSTQFGIAKLAIMIWLKYQLIWAEKYEGISCIDNDFAEVLAVLAGLDRCQQLGYENIELWSDRKRACGVISGSETIKMDDKNRMACLLLRSKLTRFKRLVSVLKPREVMFFVDGILRGDDHSGCLVRDLLDKWGPYLRGQTIYRITRTKHTTDIIRDFDKTRRTKKSEGNVHTAKSVFYWKVQKGQKFKGYRKLVDFFEPSSVKMVMDRYEQKPASLQRKMAKMFSTCHQDGTSTIFKDGKLDPQQRRLTVVWDACVPREQYGCLDSCTVILIDEEKEVEKMKERKINLGIYLHFQRADYKEEEKGKKIKDKGKRK